MISETDPLPGTQPGTLETRLATPSRSSIREVPTTPRWQRFDGANRNLTQTIPDGQSKVSVGSRVAYSFEYDAANNRIAEIDPRGDALATRTTFDTLNRPIRVETPGGTDEAPRTDVSSVQYDIVGNPIRIVDERGEAFTQVRTYDLSGQLASIVHPTDGNTIGPDTESFTYDAAGNLVTVSNVGGGECGGANDLRCVESTCDDRQRDW